MKQQVSASQHANCIEDTPGGSVFRPVWSKRTSPVVDPTDVECLPTMDADPQLTNVQTNVVYYIAGFIVRKMRGRLEVGFHA